MPATHHSRHRRQARHPRVAGVLGTLLRVLAGRQPRAAGGSTHGGAMRGGATHGGFAGGRGGRESSRRASARTEPRRPLLIRMEIGYSRAIALALALIVCILIGWRVIAVTASQNLAVSSPREALRWNPDETAALNVLAAQELANPEGDLGTARDLAERALRSRPLDDESLLLLGLIAERSRDVARADTLARMAGARTWRNPNTQLRLFQRAARRGEFITALKHADAVLRVHPHDTLFRGLLFPALFNFTRTDASFGALTDFLGNEAPAWRTALLGYISPKLENGERLDKLYKSLETSRHPPSVDEMRSYLNALVGAGRYREAAQVWRAILPPAQRADERVPYNGDFDYPVDGAPFNWLLREQTGADVDIVTIDKSGRRALRLQFSGTRVDFQNAQQLLLLPAGRYRFAGAVKSDDLQAPRGLWWRIFCATGAKQGLAHSNLVAETVPWTDFEVEFAVPAGCDAQWLMLELPARIASEKQIGGQIWYRSLRIGRLSEGAEKAP